MPCARLDMYNPEHPAGHQLMPPRMSFSSDFAVEPPPPPAPTRASGDADFEFSVGSRPMMAADQLFSKGRILPLREAGRGRSVTLRDELRGHDAEDHPSRAPRAPSSRWKELFGLKKAPKKGGESAGEGPSTSDAQLDLGDNGAMRE